MGRPTMLSLGLLVSGCKILGGGELSRDECRNLVERTIEFHLPTYERLQDPERAQTREDILRSEKGLAALANCQTTVSRASYQCALTARDPGDFEGCLSPGLNFGLASKW